MLIHRRFLCLVRLGHSETNRHSESTVSTLPQMAGASTAPLSSRDNNDVLDQQYDTMVCAGLPDDLEEPTVPEEQEKGYDEFEKLMEQRPAAVGSLQKIYDRTHARPPLTAKAQADLCTRLGKSVKILYPIVDDEHPLVPTTEYLEIPSTLTPQ